MDKLLKILSELKPGVDFEHETDLVGKGILDSLSIVMLAGEIADEFDVTVSPLDVVPENFRSAETILALIRKLQDE